MNMNRRITFFSLLLLLLSCLPSSYAIGILAPSEPGLQPLHLVSQQIHVQIADQAAKTKVEQVFHNDYDRQLEGHYLFPVPKGAQVTDFVLYINGKPQHAEVLERDKARQIYEDIVSRMKDPGLLEYIDQELFRVRIFPIPAHGDQKVEIEYAQMLKMDHGAAEYVFPLDISKTSQPQPTQIKFDFTMESSIPIKTIYSPTHKLKIDSKSDKKVAGALEIAPDATDRDITLVYTVSEKEIGLSVVPFRPNPSEPGYFAIFISPQIQMQEKEIQPKAVTFVIDTSGSMSGEKIEQAKKSLIYCLNSLRPQDSFNIIRFSSDVENLQSDLKPVTPDAIASAVSWVKTLQARGGTDIDGALQEALKATAPRNSTHTIVFLTDGMPTIGETQPGNILRNLEQRNSSQLRVFTFGLGFDVNAKLIDQIAEQTRATSQYVRPDEDIEVAVSAFFDKVASPVLTNLDLKINGVKVKDLFPRQMPDLFLGSQLIVFGRYEEPSSATVLLTGDLAGKKQTFEYSANFPKQANDYAFIEPLWAHRKVGYLLEQIRENGEQKEVVDEVIQLAKKYSIATPYTSLLVTEDEPMPAMSAAAPDVMRQRMPRSERQFGAQKAMPEGMAAPSEMPSLAGSPSGGSVPMAARAAGSADFSASSGKVAVEESIRMQEYKQKSTVSGAKDTASKRVGNRTFTRIGDLWSDQSIEKRDTVLEVKSFSPAYFEVLRLRPEIKEALALGDQVEVRLDGRTVLKIGPAGKEKLAETDINLLKSTM